MLDSESSASIHSRPVDFVLRNNNEVFDDVIHVHGKDGNECISSSSDCNQFMANNGDDAIVTHENLILRRRKMLLLMTSSVPMTTLPLLFLGVPAAAIADDQSPAQTLQEAKQCENGGVISESAVPGAYQQSCMDLDERSFVLKASGDTITVYQGTKSAGGMAGRTGVAVWNSGILLTRLLDNLCQANPSLFNNKTILELGCGTALSSIAAAKLGASSVIATDANPEVLQLAQRNIERNNVHEVAKTAALQWGLMDASEYDSAADIIIGSDLTYNSGSWVALAETMSTILKPNGVVIYLSLGHAGFNVGGEMGGFLSVVGNMGLQLLTKDSMEWKDIVGSSRSIEDLISSMITPEEKQEIDANGGVRVVFLGKKKYARKG